MILRRVGYAVNEAGDAHEAILVLTGSHFDLIFLDLQMPDRDGLDLLPEITRLTPDTPVLILTANGSVEKAIEALRLGARDYLLKPIEPGQIITRVDDILKKRPQTDPEGESMQVIKVGQYVLDMEHHRVSLEDQAVQLPDCSFEYLAALARHAPQPVSYQDLVKEAQGYKLDKLEAQDLARWRIYHLRKLLEGDPSDPEFIRSVPGYGFRLVPDPA